MLTEERGVTRGKGGYADQWHHNVRDEHGNLKFTPGTKKHHEGRAEQHKLLSRDANHIDHFNHAPKEKHHIIAVADAHKKAAEAHEKVLTLKGKQLHPDHPHVHAAMKATEDVHKAEKAQKDYHNSSEYKALEKKREKRRERENDRMRYQASIEDHKRNLAHAKDPSIPRHDEAKAELADYHATRKALKDPNHPDHKWAKVKNGAHPYKYGDHLAKLKEDLDADPQSMDNKRLSVIARNPNHPLHTHAKAELARRKIKKSEMDEQKVNEISLDDLKAKISSSGLKSIKKAMGADKIKKDIEAMKAKLATEADQFGRLGITSPTMKHIDKKLDKVTKRTQTVMNKRPRSTMEEKDPEEYDNEGSIQEYGGPKISRKKYLEQDPMKETKAAPKGYHFTKSGQLKKGDADVDGPGGKKLRADPLDKQRSKIPPLPEKTLTPAEKKKREEIAKAIERENPGIPMNQKMAIATATAKRVAEGAYLKGSIESRADAHEDQADHHERQAEKAHKDGDRLAASTHKAAARAHMKAASYYDNYLSKPKHLRPQAASGGASQAAHVATQKANQYNESVAEAYKEPQGQAKRMMSPLQKARMDKEKADRDADGKLKEKTGLKRDTLKSYIKKASKDAADRGMDAVDKAKSGDTLGFGKQFVKSRDRVKNVAKAVDKLEDTKPDAAEVMREQQQIANISTSDKDKLAKIRAMLDKEKHKIYEEKDPRLARAGVSGFNKAKRTPGHPTKSHIVVAKSGDKVKTIRFGQQGVTTAGAPKEGESNRQKNRRKSFKARHAKNIAKGKMSAAYWANKEKW